MPKKRKKLKRKHTKKNERRRKYSESSSDSSDNESTSSNCSDQWIEKKTTSKAPKRDNWMTEETSFIPTYSLHELKERRKNERESKNEKKLLDQPGQSAQELNPYWKNGGAGLPADREENLQSSTSYTSADWLKKALRRAQEQAEEENRSLESIAAERYGSLKNLYNMIAEAEAKDSRYKSDYRNHFPSSHSSKSNTKFIKPSEDTAYSSESISTKSGRGWKKSTKPAETELKALIETSLEKSTYPTNSGKQGTILTNEEMNLLASKLVKAEIMGNQNLITELTAKLEAARKAREAKTDTNAHDNKVLLTHTNCRGYSQPLKGKHDVSADKKRKYETHVDGTRVKYFEDDDKYTLVQMFEKEQMTSSADSNEEFLRLSSQATKSKSDDFVDLFMEQSTSNRPSKSNDIQKAIGKHEKSEKALESCTSCLTNNKLQKHLIISTCHKTYLSVPHFESLTEGHCLIVPIYHATCSTLLDEDVWEEILDYCKKLTKMFREDDQDVVFFESAMNFKYYPHMVIHCVPIPDEVGNLAPIYFKKALLECETEWAQNKKLVNVSRMDVRRVIPKGLPYFFAHFGLDNGYAHVIEDEKLFSKNFAQEIIGGMLDLDHRKWRKPRLDDFETQCKKVNKFTTLWKST